MIALILAAGNSSRFAGKNKLLLPIRGIPMLQHVVHALDQDSISEIRIVTGKYDSSFRATIFNSKIKWIYNENYSQGMSASIRFGLQGIDSVSVMITPGDMPLYKRETIMRLIMNHQPDTISIPTFENTKGHPVILDNLFIKACLTEKSEKALYATIKKNEKHIVLIETTDRGILTDIDNPLAYDLLKDA